MANVKSNEAEKPMELIKYSERSFVAHGLATKTHKDILKESGGGYNRNLTHPQTGEPLSGWVFPMKKKTSLINDLIMNDIEYLNSIE